MFVLLKPDLGGGPQKLDNVISSKSAKKGKELI
jgi:hypothetical protein